MKCASLLNEILWSMVAEIKSVKDFDYKSYTGKIFCKYNKQLNYYNSLMI